VLYTAPTVNGVKTPLSGLEDGKVYYVNTATNEFNLTGDQRLVSKQVIRLARTENEARAGVIINLGSSTANGHTLSALHVLDSDLATGLGVIAQLDATDKASATGGQESKDPKPGKPDDSNWSWQGSVFNSIFSGLTNMYYADKAAKATSKGGAASSSLHVAGSFAFSFATTTSPRRSARTPSSSPTRTSRSRRSSSRPSARGREHDREPEAGPGLARRPRRRDQHQR
jgi:hypothetical protein